MNELCIVLVLIALVGWALFLVWHKKYAFMKEMRETERSKWNYESEQLSKKLDAIQKKYDDCQAAVAFSEQWKAAPEMLEEMKELRQLLLVSSGKYLSESAEKEISKVGWGVYHSENADYATLISEAENRIRALVSENKAVIFEQNHPFVPEVAALLLDAFDGYAWRYTHFSTKAEAQRLQYLKLAFYLINIRGASVFHASLSHDYLEAHLNLFRIKLQLEEYKRLRREDEKAIRQLETQQSVEEIRILRELNLQKKKLEAAHASEKAALEHRIADLEAQLEASRRTISNAQLTKQGTVYVISNIGSFGENVYKIGMTRRADPQERIEELSSASVPFPFDVHAFINTTDAPKLEYELHEYFKSNKINTAALQGREFYRVSLRDIQSKISEMGLSVRWEETAEAAQYRASMSAHPLIKQEWSSVSSDHEAQKMPSTTESLIAFLDKTGICWVDKRNMGGCLWIESTPNNDPILRELVVDGKPIMYAKKTKNFNGSSGWFIA